MGQFALGPCMRAPMHAASWQHCVCVLVYTVVCMHTWMYMMYNVLTVQLSLHYRCHHHLLKVWLEINSLCTYIAC